MSPCNNIVNINFDMLFFFLNLDVRYSSVRIIINSEYGRKSFSNSTLKTDNFEFSIRMKRCFFIKS